MGNTYTGQDRLRPPGRGPAEDDPRERDRVARSTGTRTRTRLRRERFSRPHRHDQLQRRLPGVNHQEFLEGSNDWADPPAQPAGLDGLRRRGEPNFDPSLVDGTQDITLEDALDLSHDLIDIKPNDKNNTINLGSTATFEVAIFSRESADGRPSTSTPRRSTRSA